jgi:two-component system, cell cycle response regulator DivK
VHQFSEIKHTLTNWVILLVDDNPDNIIVAKSAFKYYGAQVHTATNGEECLAKLEQLTPTVLLLDLRMPKLDGWATLRRIRQNPGFDRIPVIALTAYAMDGDRERVLEAGFDGYISKPFDVFTLATQVQILVDVFMNRNSGVSK